MFGVRICRGAPCVSSFLWKTSGQAVNLHKSNVTFSGNVKSQGRYCWTGRGKVRVMASILVCMAYWVETKKPHLILGIFFLHR